jgi:hypothetical protein
MERRTATRVVVPLAAVVVAAIVPVLFLYWSQARYRARIADCQVCTHCVNFACSMYSAEYDG